MEDVYDDLENFNDVNVVNELRAENEELKQKLGQYAESMATLQKDFDNLSAELKKLETNYSSLLKSARAEIKRKTDMIKNLNVEKDILVLKQFQEKPGHRQKLMNVHKVKPEENVNKINNPNTAEDLKQRDEFRKSPSENSSTTTEKSIKSLNTENRIGEFSKSITRNISKESETHQSAVFPHHRENYHDDRLQRTGVIDRRMSTITSQQFLKFSSDEEFEDMYSALEPKTTSKGTSFGDEPQKGQKRFRDEPQHVRAYNELCGPPDKRPNYTDTSRDRFNKNRNRRFNENERNINRDKYNLSHPNRNKYSPDQARYDKRDFGDDRFGQKYDRHRWMENAPGDRYQHKRRERRPYPDRGRSDQNIDMDRNNHPEFSTGKHRLASSTQIHGEYEQPPMKRFRGDQYLRTDEDRRRNDRQFPHEYHQSEMREAYRETQVNYEFTNSIYADLDKPTSDSAMLPGEGNTIEANEDVVGHNLEIERNEETKNNSQNMKKNNIKENLRPKHTEEKCNEKDKTQKTTKYKIPLKGHQFANDKHSETSKAKSNKVDTSTHSGETAKSSLPHTDLSSATACIKNSEVAKTLESSKMNNSDPTRILSKIPKIDKNETDVGTTFERVLEQKLASIRNIVEGDLELSDETNDDNQVQLKDNDLRDTKTKHKIKKKSHRDISKDKTATRKTRSKTDKDKDIRAKNKFSELFGDSNSLITPEDLELASTPAPAHITDAYAAVYEDAQDGIHLQDKQSSVRTVAAKKEISGPASNVICPQADTLQLKDKTKTNDIKDSKSRAHHRKHRKSELRSSDDVKDFKKVTLSNIINPPTAESVKTTVLSDVEKNVSREASKEQNDQNKTGGDLLQTVLMSEVKTVVSNKNCKGTPKETNLDKTTKSKTILMPDVNTAEVINENSKDILNSNKPYIVETYLMPKVKALSARSKQITDSSKLNKNTESGVLEAHFTPEAKSVESVDKLNSSKSDIKTDIKVVETHLKSDVKPVASCEKSGEVFELVNPDCKDDHIIETPLMVEAKPAVSDEKPKEMSNVIKPEKKKHCEKNKDHAKSNKKSKCNEDKMMLSSGNSKESYVNKTHSIAESNKPLIRSSNKENESCESLEGTTNYDLPKTFEDPLIPIEKTNVDINKSKEEQLTVSILPKETNSKTRIDDTPNLKAVIEDPGLVNTVVISTGVQPSDANVLPVNTAGSDDTSLKALATPIPALNTLSEIKPHVNPLTSSANIKTPNENTVSKNDESDVPDVRIYCYRRRRKLVK